VHARLARYAIEPDRLDDAVESFRQAGRELSELAGFEGGHVLVDYDEGTLMTLTLWESRAAVDASDVRAATLRQRALRAVDGEVQSVTCYEVPVELGRRASG
jgi:heme-degrading monooxygenase HmoA